jgi:FkbM family methyltransferase
MNSIIKIHEFDNGIKVYDKHLIDIQRIRYNRINVHEAEEEQLFLSQISTLKKKACFVNIGSAIGYYALLAKKTRPDLFIHAFEPLRMHRKFFRQNIRLNKFKKEDFNIYSQGIYTTNKFVIFKKKRYGSVIDNYNHPFSIKNIIQHFKEYGFSLIKVITIADIINQLKKEIDLLQMDIQGLEFEVLNSSKNLLLQKKIKNFIIGTHSLAIHQKCLDLLTECGYNIIHNNPVPKEQPDGIIAASII